MVKRVSAKRAAQKAVRCAQEYDSDEILRRGGASDITINAYRKLSIGGLSAGRARLNFWSVWNSAGHGMSRYSDGSHRVLYTADSLEVSIVERIYWAVDGLRRSRLRANKEVGPFFCYTCSVSGLSKDYLNCLRIDPELVNSSDYSFCHGIAKKDVSDGVDFARVPSARRELGVCVPIYNKKSVEFIGECYEFKILWRIIKKEAVLFGSDGAKYTISFDNVYRKYKK